MPAKVPWLFGWSWTIGLASLSVALADPMPAPLTLPTPQAYIRFSGGDGSSCDKAVVIVGANHEPEGVRAQRWWIYTNNVGSKIVSQTVSERNGRDLETFELLTPDGGRKQVCFDITSFYGKP